MPQNPRKITKKVRRNVKRRTANKSKTKQKGISHRVKRYKI